MYSHATSFVGAINDYPEPAPTYFSTDAYYARDYLGLTSASTYKWSTFVANTGGQDAVDQCAGGLTDMTAVVGMKEQRYFPIHNQCGGDPILKLEPGDTVFIAELGAFAVVDARDVSRGDTTAALNGLGGAILVQTCYDFGPDMRVVGLDSAWE
jgi:hypothetical protein